MSTADEGLPFPLSGLALEPPEAAHVRFLHDCEEIGREALSLAKQLARWEWHQRRRLDRAIHVGFASLLDEQGGVGSEQALERLRELLELRKTRYRHVRLEVEAIFFYLAVCELSVALSQDQDQDQDGEKALPTRAELVKRLTAQYEAFARQMPIQTALGIVSFTDLVSNAHNMALWIAVLEYPLFRASYGVGLLAIPAVSSALGLVMTALTIAILWPQRNSQYARFQIGISVAAAGVSVASDALNIASMVSMVTHVAVATSLSSTVLLPVVFALQIAQSVACMVEIEHRLASQKKQFDQLIQDAQDKSSLQLTLEQMAVKAHLQGQLSLSDFVNPAYGPILLKLFSEQDLGKLKAQLLEKAEYNSKIELAQQAINIVQGVALIILFSLLAASAIAMPYVAIAVVASVALVLAMNFILERFKHKGEPIDPSRLPPLPKPTVGYLRGDTGGAFVEGTALKPEVPKKLDPIDTAVGPATIRPDLL